jgi:hypothetical protein
MEAAREHGNLSSETEAEALEYANLLGVAVGDSEDMDRLARTALVQRSLRCTMRSRPPSR